jgi:hypothetical protein
MKRLNSNLALLLRPAPDYVDAKALAAGGSPSPAPPATT